MKTAVLDQKLGNWFYTDAKRMSFISNSVAKEHFQEKVVGIYIPLGRGRLSPSSELTQFDDNSDNRNNVNECENFGRIHIKQAKRDVSQQAGR